MKLYINNIFAFVIVAIAMIIFTAPVQAQYYPIGWHKTSSTMSSDSIWITGNDGHNSAKFLRTSYNGAFGDTVTWVLDGLDIPYEGWFQYSVRGSNGWGNNASSLTISDGITTETVGGVGAAGGPEWGTVQYHNDTPALSHITTIIVRDFFWQAPGDGPVSIDWDDFWVKIGGVWQRAYQCGDVGNITGTVWADVNHNGQWDVGELPLGGVTLYLTDTGTDSVTSDSSGYYQFLNVSQGTYQLSQQVSGGYVQTKPVNPSYYTVTLSNSMLLVEADFGSMPDPGTTLVVQQGWNMVSVPVLTPDFRTQAIFTNAISPTYAYNGAYSVVETLQNGPGYWMKYASAQIVPMSGAEVTSTSVEVVEGWNLFGSITAPVALTNITSNDPELTLSLLYRYKGKGYQQVDTVQNGEGYWIKASKSGTVVLSSQPPSATTYRVRIVPTNEAPPPAPGSSNEGLTPPLIPSEFRLEQNYPNPFNPTTEIVYQVSEAGFVHLTVYNVLGQTVATLVSEVQNPGNYQVQWDANGNPSGMYFYKLQAGEFTSTKKMLLMK